MTKNQLSGLCLNDKVYLNFTVRANQVSEENMYRAKAYSRVAALAKKGIILENLSNSPVKGIGSSSMEKIEILKSSPLLPEVKMKDINSLDFKVEEERVPVEDALKIAQPIFDFLNDSFKDSRLSYAGSIRRGKRRIHDIDLVACNKDPEIRQSIIDQFIMKMDSVRTHGSTKASGYKNGLLMEIFVVAPEQYASTMLHCTGSGSFSMEMRRVLKSKGFGFSHKGIRDQDGIYNTYSSEEEIFHHCGMRYLEPAERAPENIVWFKNPSI